MSTPPPPPATVLLTRPEAAARATAARLAPLPVLSAPLLAIVPVAHDRDAVAAAAGLVFTSVHGIAAAGLGRGRPAWCVGAATAAAARLAGFAAIAGPGDAEGLATLLAKAGVGPLLHLHGRHVAGATLGVPGLVVYDQVAQPLSAPARALLAAPGRVIAPVYSPRAAGLLAAALRAQPARATVHVVAISPAAAAAWGAAAASVTIAARPDGAAMDRAVIAAAAPEPACKGPG